MEGGQEIRIVPGRIAKERAVNHKWLAPVCGVPNSGFIYFIQRRRFVEEKSESALIETARLVSVSMLTNLAALGLFALFRHFDPGHHTPNPEALSKQGWSYVKARPGYVLVWGLIILGVSTLLAFLLARISRSGLNIKWFIPDIVHTSAWNRYLGDTKVIPAGTTPFVGLLLSDGTYVTGFVAWLSTELDEVADRDLVLAPPIRIYRDWDLILTRVAVSA